jgi:hypothetical protein
LTGTLLYPWQDENWNLLNLYIMDCTMISWDYIIFDFAIRWFQHSGLTAFMLIFSFFAHDGVELSPNLIWPMVISTRMIILI